MEHLIPPPPPQRLQSAALREFSEALFKANDFLPEGLLLTINEAAMKLHKECARPPPAVRGTDVLERVRGQMFGQIAELHELRSECADYNEQLQSATLLIDKLRERRDFFIKCTTVLKGVCISTGIPDGKLLEAYDRAGVLDKVLEERERKRKRDDNGVPIEIIAVSPVSNGSEEEDSEDEEGEEDEEDEYEDADEDLASA
jgi:hypothetical protein